MRDVRVEKEMRLRQQLKRRERQEKIDRALAHNGIEKATKLFALMYLQVSQLAVTLDDFNDQMDEIGFEDGRTNHAIRRLGKDFDDFFDKLSFLVGKDEVEKWAEELVRFGELVNKFGGVEE